VTQDPVNGTGSAALLAAPFVRGETFLLTFGDILCEPAEYTRCVSIFDTFRGTMAVLGVKWVEDPWQGAAVYEQEGLVLRVIEKPAKGSSTTHWNSAGIYAFQPVVFEYLSGLKPSARNEYELTSAIAEMIAADLEVRISPIEGHWRDVGRPEDLRAESEEPSSSQ
jgi:UDP-N-acetylglucosamine diphosphorylase / glucose-1-phosphate thymidylyltransferase / UDP-N-acetylgalactosamine diphosphorylase / glucosamine-1-phosphate N-acetyltransferase / galactosamine-1-phosphate N-acetyltransferase